MGENNKKNKWIKIIVISLTVLIAYYAFLKWKSGRENKESYPVVIVEKPQIRKMAEYVTQTGNTVAYNAVDLVARVEGYLQEVNFTDGSFVKKGKQLFVIQPEPYKQQLKQAKASVDAEKAGLAYANAEYARQQRMYKENATSLNSVQIWLAKSNQSSAGLAKAIANEKNTEITYSYTHIEAPFDGRINRHLVDPGNLVGNGTATKLATIEQINPIYVYFNLNELDLIKLRKAASQHGIKPEDVNKIPIAVAMQNEKGFPHKGMLDYVSTQLNPSTGTIEFRALLQNKTYKLLPGLFVKVRIEISPKEPYLTVPDTAVQYDQIGPYLYTVNKKNMVALTRVNLGPLQEGIRAIKKGLSKDDRVVVSGIQNAAPKEQVTPRQKSKEKSQ